MLFYVSLRGAEGDPSLLQDRLRNLKCLGCLKDFRLLRFARNDTTQNSELSTQHYPRMIVTTDAIVLRSRKQGDSSLICSLYTRSFGLVDVIAKGARQMKSKFGGGLELYTELTAVFYKKHGRDLYLLSKAETQKRSTKLQASLEKIEASTKIAELLLGTLHDEEENPKLYDLLQKTLGALGECKNDSSVTAHLAAFYLAYAKLNGFEISTPAEIIADIHYAFDARSGGVIELRSPLGEGSDTMIPITGEVVAALRHLTNAANIDAGALRLSERGAYTLERIFRAYFALHFEGMRGANRSRSAKVFAQMGEKG